jgi:tetratricopeptide (TPR) repeat protein
MNELFVNIWEEKVSIPTYTTGKPEKNPMFFEKRVYQGSSGVVYPNPVIEKIYDHKEDETYTGLFLENKYLKIMILPELGGRVQMAYDKIKERHFVYYNQVIKPALVGLCGPWISGGIEFNWPQHHRPSTFEPIDYSIEENADGSKTVWVNEVEKMFLTKGMAGFTLHPDKAYLEIKGKLYNRTALPQTFLWWANPAVKVNDDYQSVFPPDVNAVFDHGKRDVSDFPIATGTYYKVDYSPGTDISKYKNIPVPTSYMAIRSDYDFVGGYENDAKAGLLHVANHHISPGKKQWTWGNGDFGKAWDRNLTDEDGPYIELMTGVHTDNQPDFSWLMPYEEKSFVQYFMPYRELGLVKNASKDILVSFKANGKQAILKIFATSVQDQNKVSLFIKDELVYSEMFRVSPEQIFEKGIELNTAINEQDVLLTVHGAGGKELIRYQPSLNKKNTLPEPAKAAPPPQEVENNEQLFLTGMHLEQYRHATYNPIDYYEEALRRDDKDVRVNNALGKWYLRRGQLDKSEPYFHKAIETLVSRNPNPYDGEPYYNLGLCLKLRGKYDEAYNNFYKAAWNSAWQDSAYFSLAQIAIARGDFEQALDHIEWSIDKNARNSKALALKVIILRKLNRLDEAIKVSKDAIKRDLFNLAIYFEQSKIYRAAGQEEKALKALNSLFRLSRQNVHNYMEYALDYAAANQYDAAIELISFALDQQNSDTYPMVFYYLSWFCKQSGQSEAALTYGKNAALANPDYCFPNRIEDVAVLRFAISTNNKDGKAPYYLGNLWYDKRQYNDAIEMWELAAERDSTFPTVWRNLGIACFNKRNDATKALDCYEKAFTLDPTDARIFMELDQLYKRLNQTPGKRLTFLEQHLDLVERRDDVYLERAALYNMLGQYNKAYDLIMARQFHPWEGGEGKVSGQYIYSLIEMAKQHLHAQEYQQAIHQLALAMEYPDNLGEGKLYGAQENDIFYWLGCAYEGLGQQAKALECFTIAVSGLAEPSAAMFYNDQQPDKIFYQGLASLKLNEREKAALIFNKLIDYGKTHSNDRIKIDYFAVSLPDMLIFEDDLDIRNKIHCHYLIGLGLLGQKNMNNARKEFESVLQHDVMHFGASIHLMATGQQEQVAIKSN